MKFVRWITQYNKFLISATMGVIYFTNSKYGVEIPLDEATVAAIWSAVTSLAVFITPNRQET